MRCFLEVPRASQEVLQGTRDGARDQGRAFQRQVRLGPPGSRRTNRGLSGAAVPGLRRGRFRLAAKPAALSSGTEARRRARDPAGAIERMVDEGPVELSDPASVSVDLGGDEHAAADADIVWDDALPEPPPAATPSRWLRPGRWSRRRAQSTWASPARLARRQVQPQGRRRRRRREVHAADDRASECRRLLGRAGSPGRKRAATRRSLGAETARTAAAHAGPGDGPHELVHEIKPASRIRTLNRWLLVRRAGRGDRDRRLALPAARPAGVPVDRRERSERRNSGARSGRIRQGPPASLGRQIRQSMRSAGPSRTPTRYVRPPIEAAIYVNLLPQDLGDLLTEAGRTDSADDVGVTVRQALQGPSIIVEQRGHRGARWLGCLQVRAGVANTAAGRIRQSGWIAGPRRRIRSDGFQVVRAQFQRTAV